MLFVFGQMYKNTVFLNKCEHFVITANISVLRDSYVVIIML